jgi:hypothetical protein
MTQSKDDALAFSGWIRIRRIACTPPHHQHAAVGAAARLQTSINRAMLIDEEQEAGQVVR